MTENIRRILNHIVRGNFGRRRVRRYFHVDRAGTLQAGHQIALVRYADIKPPELQQHVDKIFHDGLSIHGEHYFLKNDIDARATSAYNELTFEWIRRGAFPDRPSRFASFFATETIDDARKFRALFSKDATGNPIPAAIWEVKGKGGFRADMALISGQQATILPMSYLAHTYWSGTTPNPEPFWEVVLPLPIWVVRRIE